MVRADNHGHDVALDRAWRDPVHKENHQWSGGCFLSCLLLLLMPHPRPNEVRMHPSICCERPVCSWGKIRQLFVHHWWTHLSFEVVWVQLTELLQINVFLSKESCIQFKQDLKLEVKTAFVTFESPPTPSRRGQGGSVMLWPRPIRPAAGAHGSVAGKTTDWIYLSLMGPCRPVGPGAPGAPTAPKSSSFIWSGTSVRVQKSMSSRFTQNNLNILSV